MNKRTPKIPKFVKDDPYLETIISKLTTKKSTPDTRKKTSPLTNTGLSKVTDSIRERIRNNEDIVQLFPDVELSIQILTSSILSPNDMMMPTLQYKDPEIDLPISVKNQLLDTIKKHINKHYDVEDKMSTMLREAMFTKGAYIEAILPDNTLNEIMNEMSGEISVESYIDDLPITDLGFINTDTYTTTISTEEFGLTGDKQDNIVYTEEDIGVIVTDNLKTILSLEAYTRQIPDVINNKIYDSTISTEEMTILTRAFGKNRTDNKRNKDVVVMNNMDTASGEAIGRPVIFKLPVESVIPVYASTDVSKHLGYFVLLNEKGVPIDMDNTAYVTDDMSSQSINNNNNKSNILEKAKKGIMGITKKDPKLNNVEDIYYNIITTMLKDKLAKGLYGDVATIKENSDLYRVMLHNTLAGQKTKLLYIPQEMVAYYAFDYRDNGTGKSLLEKVNMLFSIRAILLFSNVMANLKNSVTTTSVSATLDEHDPDPSGTKELLISEALKTRQTQLPLGVMKIDDLVEWSHKVGFRFDIKHPGLPEMDITVDDSSPSKTVPDTELDEKIQEHIIQSFGLTKELVSAGYDPEFATTVVSNNILLAKRVTEQQRKFCTMLSSNICKILKNDPTIQLTLKSIINANIAAIKKSINSSHDNTDNATQAVLKNDKLVTEYILKEYISKLTVSLPKPELSDDANKIKTAFENYVENLDTVLDNLISTDMLSSEVIGEASDHLDNIKAVYKTILIKNWLASNNYMPDINSIFELDSEGKPVFDLLNEFTVYSETLGSGIMPFLKNQKKVIDKINDKIDKLDEEDSEDDDTSSADDTSDDDTSTDDSTDDTSTDDTTGDDTSTDDNIDDTSTDDTGTDDLTDL